jgi:hypothetical protein
MRRLLPVPCLLALPAAAYACAACGAGVDRNRAVFFSTIFLSLLPLALLVAGVLWLRQRYRARFPRQLGETEAPTATVGADAGAGARGARARIAVVPAAGPRA